MYFTCLYSIPNHNSSPFTFRSIVTLNSSCYVARHCEFSFDPNENLYMEYNIKTGSTRILRVHHVVL